MLHSNDSPPSPPHHLRETFFLLLLSLFGLTACGIPAPPVPPTPKIPQPVQDLTVKMRGGKALLRFTLPQRNADGTRRETPPTLEVFQLVLEKGAEPEAALAENPVPAYVLPPETVKNFLENNAVVFPADLKPGQPGQTLFFAVRARNAKGKEAGFSNIATLNSLPIPPPPEGFQADSTETGVRLQWNPVAAPPAPNSKPEDTLVGYRIFRSSTGEPNSFRPIVSVPASNALITSFVDRKIEWGHQYHYRIRTVVFYGNERGEGPGSAPITIVAEDRFPPPPPRRLIASEGPNRVDLSWDAPQGEELQGYLIYRSTLPGSDPNTNFVRITVSPITSLNYTDSTAQPGVKYYYVVTAMDKAGNESPRSNQTSATLFQP